MSGMKEFALVEFHRSLRPMGGVQGLAEVAQVGRAHLCQVLAGKRSGVNTWKRILPLLSVYQIQKLTACSCWDESAAAEMERLVEKLNRKTVRTMDFVPDGTLCYVEQ